LEVSDTPPDSFYSEWFVFLQDTAAQLSDHFGELGDGWVFFVDIVVACFGGIEENGSHYVLLFVKTSGLQRELRLSLCQIAQTEHLHGYEAVSGYGNLYGLWFFQLKFFYGAALL
jgi:hypothetical protein